jgi:predicted Ser/Thr protein kinase
VTLSPADPAAAEGPPSHIGRYRVVERIGKGTMGMVYAAEDDTMGRRVAIKLMMGDLQDDPELRERFYREAKVTSQLAHRNIITVLDLGEDNGHPFIVMELLKGLPLAAHLRTAAPGLEARISLMEQICEGLQVAHCRGVIHRDIKPSNLFVQEDGTLKILDFGVARPASSGLTLSGLMVGTPEYISPEQALGKPVDARSDLFAAAAVFYFMLTGRGPFTSQDLPAVLRAVLHEDPPPLTDDEAPASLRRIVMKALAKAPADRYQQCDELLKELEQVRRAWAGTSHRIAQAALDRYRQIVRIIEERRALGHANGVPGIDAACDEDAARLAARFAIFARQAPSPIFTESLDRAAASAALEALQTRHNAEQAALAAMRAQAADVMHPAERRGADDPSHGGPSSLATRATAFWRRLVSSRGPS